MPVTRYDWNSGPIPLEHPALACPECDGQGGHAELLAAGSADPEPRYRDVPCKECLGSGVRLDLECAECFAPLAPAAYGVGAIVEREIERPLFCYAPDGPKRQVTRFHLLCGPCAWAEALAE